MRSLRDRVSGFGVVLESAIEPEIITPDSCYRQATMGCFAGCAALLFPRLVLFIMFLTGSYIGRAYETNLWPILGFFFMPLTTIAYAWAVNTNGTVTGGYLVVVVIAVLMDLGANGNGAHHGRKRWD